MFSSFRPSGLCALCASAVNLFFRLTDASLRSRTEVWHGHLARVSHGRPARAVLPVGKRLGPRPGRPWDPRARCPCHSGAASVRLLREASLWAHYEPNSPHSEGPRVEAASRRFLLSPGPRKRRDAAYAEESSKMPLPLWAARRRLYASAPPGGGENRLCRAAGGGTLHDSPRRVAGRIELREIP